MDGDTTDGVLAMDVTGLDRLDPRQLGQRLQAARKARRLTQEEVAEKLGLARTTLVAIEQGTRRIRPGELIEMAKLYTYSLSELMLEGPSVPAFAVQFRAAMRSVDAQESATGMEAVEVFRRWCERYAYLESLSGAPRTTPLPQPLPTANLPPDRAGELAARNERNLLGLGGGPVTNLRALLEEERGLRVFLLDLPGAVAGLFSYSPEFGACLAVNLKHPPERRTWSMAHEYGHFVVNPHEANYLPEHVPEHGRGLSPLERTADAFARHFLLPSEAVARRFDLLVQEERGQITPAGLIGLADYFGVSFKAMLHRLEELGRIPQGTWRRLYDKGFRVREAQEILGYGRPPMRQALYPRRYLLLAVWAFASSKIGESKLAELLDVDRLTARELVQELIDSTGAEGIESLAKLLSGGLV